MRQQTNNAPAKSSSAFPLETRRRHNTCGRQMSGMIPPTMTILPTARLRVKRGVCVHLCPSFDYVAVAVPTVAPRALPRDLQAFWDTVAGHTKNTGYAWGQTPHWAANLKCSLRHANRILRELVDAGRLVIVRIRGSKERHFYVIDLPAETPPVSCPELDRILPRSRTSPYKADYAMRNKATDSETPSKKPTSAPAPSDPGFAAAVEILRQEGMPEPSAKQIAREIPDAKRLRDAVAYYRQRVKAGQNIRNWVGYVLQVARLRAAAPVASSYGLTAAEERQREQEKRRRYEKAPAGWKLNSGAKQPPQDSTRPVQASETESGTEVGRAAWGACRAARRRAAA